MVPFITLEEPRFQNIPSPEESKRFEAYMDLYVTASNRQGVYFDGSKYFPQDDPDDLALTFEKALYTWRMNHKKVTVRYTMEITKDSRDRILDESCVDCETLQEVCKLQEEHLVTYMNNAIRDHLERTGGKIGHFPYRGERMITSYADDDGTQIPVKLNPMDLNWSGVYAADLVDAALYNTPGTEKSGVVSRKTLRDMKDKRLKKLKQSMAKRAKRVCVSMAVFLISFLGTMLVNKVFGQMKLGPLMIISDVIFVSLIVAVINLFLLWKDWREMNGTDAFSDVRTDDYFWMYSAGFGRWDRPVHYDKDSFKRDVILIHKYIRFWQLWDQAYGVSSPWIKAFYTAIAPFVFNGTEYIP